MVIWIIANTTNKLVWVLIGSNLQPPQYTILHLVLFFSPSQHPVLEARLLQIEMNFASLPVGHHEGKVPGKYPGHI